MLSTSILMCRDLYNCGMYKNCIWGIPFCAKHHVFYYLMMKHDISHLIRTNYWFNISEVNECTSIVNLTSLYLEISIDNCGLKLYF